MSKYLIDFDEDSDEHPQPLFARSGWKIPQPPPAWAAGEQFDLEKMQFETIKTVTLMRDSKQRSIQIRSVSTHVYSCVSMIFSSRRTWIDINHIYDILREDQYVKVPEIRLCTGDVVLYTDGRKPSHVGLVTKVFHQCGRVLNVRVLSKWGYVGEIEHNVDDVPDTLGNRDSYWSERMPYDA